MRRRRRSGEAPVRIEEVAPREGAAPLFPRTLLPNSATALGLFLLLCVLRFHGFSLPAWHSLIDHSYSADISQMAAGEDPLRDGLIADCSRADFLPRMAPAPGANRDAVLKRHLGQGNHRMSVRLNHVIVWCRDKQRSATFLAEILSRSNDSTRRRRSSPQG